MPQRHNERCVIKNGQEKSCKIKRADDPEPFFELEPGRAHDAFVAAVALSCNPMVQRFVAGRASLESIEAKAISCHS